MTSQEDASGASSARQDGSDLINLIEALLTDDPDKYQRGLALQEDQMRSDTEKAFRSVLNDQCKLEDLLPTANFAKLKSIQFSNTSELSIIDAAIALEKIDIVLDLVLTRPNDILPACMSVLIQLKPRIASKKGNYIKLEKLRADVLNLATACLDKLYSSANDKQKKWLFHYIKGSLIVVMVDKKDTSGPKFPCRIYRSSAKHLTIMEMIDESGEGDLFANECLHQLIRKEWNSAGKATHFAETPEAVSSKMHPCYFSPRVKFYVHLISFLIFNVFFAWYIMDFTRTFKLWPVEFLLASYFLSFTLQEVHDIFMRSKIKRVNLGGIKLKCPTYVTDVLNLFDFSTLIVMWTGLFWKLAIWGCIFDYVTNVESSSMCMETNSTTYQALFRDVSGNRTLTQPTPYSAYACQMIMSTAFLLWGFRSVSFLSYSERIGPVVSMLKTLIIQDLLPFSVLIVIIFYSFGVFFFNMLYPVVTSTEADRNESDYTWHAFLQVFMLPLNLLFTNFDVLPTETAKGKDQVLGEIPHHLGYKWFSRVLIFVFLLLANIVMMNLLIARFSLTVSRMDSKSLEIWRKRNVEMLREYQSCSPVPAPFSFIHYIYKLIRWCQKKKNKVSPQVEVPWNNESEYPESYRSFLSFQREQLRCILDKYSRRELPMPSESDGKVLVAHMERLVSSVKQELISHLDLRMNEIVQRMHRENASYSLKLTGADPSTSSS